MERGVGFLMLAALLLPLLSAHAQDAAPARSWCVSAWYPSAEHLGGYRSLMDHLDIVDEVNPFWYAANADGSLSPMNGAEDAGQLAAWREAGLLVLPTIAHASPLAISDPRTRAQHLEALLSLAQRMDYAGLDLDYEGFPLSTRDAFSEFVETLAARLHADGRLLSVTVHPKTSDQAGWEAAAAQDWPRLAAAADIFRIMTYDYTSRASREPGPIGPPVWAAEVLAYAAAVTDLGKVRLGLHFYGYHWQRRRASVITWESAQRVADSFHLAFERDPADMEARLEIDVGGLPKQTIVVADAVGLAFKLEMLLAAYPDLGGVAIWGLGGEDPAIWDVLREVRLDKCDL